MEDAFARRVGRTAHPSYKYRACFASAVFLARPSETRSKAINGAPTRATSSEHITASATERERDVHKTYSNELLPMDQKSLHPRLAGCSLSQLDASMRHRIAYASSEPNTPMR